MSPAAKPPALNLDPQKLAQDLERGEAVVAPEGLTPGPAHGAPPPEAAYAPGPDQFSSSLRDFESKVFQALRTQGAGRGRYACIEAPQDVLDFHNPGGTGAVPFFIYKGVRVFKEGTMADFLRDEAQDVDQRIHRSTGRIVSP